MSKDKSNSDVQVEELQDADLDQAQGGFKVEIEGVTQSIKPRLTDAEKTSIRKYDGSSELDKIIKPGTKIRGPAADPG